MVQVYEVFYVLVIETEVVTQQCWPHFLKRKRNWPVNEREI